VPGGAGPDGDIVGFSTLCPHKGYPLAYSAGDKTLNCPGHYSRFDCEKGTWGTGKLYFGAMKVKNIRIHNRPAYNSEVHGSRDMGVGELNNCYEDAQLADTIVAVCTNALETQTNYFLNHWVPNLRGTSLDKKKAEFGNEPVAQGRVVIVDPRRTVTVNACEVEAGKDNVLHLALNSGTDLALFNAWLTYAA
jgi:arsenite oxidase large subunit